MDEEIERLVIAVRGDTQGFARDVAEMRAQLDGPLANSVTRAGSLIEASLARAIRSGSFGFDDLKRVALGALGEIADAAVRAVAGGGAGGFGASGSGGLLGLGVQLLGSLLGGAPGRATGGPVAPGRAYRVGERGPEMFVPTSSGRVEPMTAAAPRDVRISIAVNAPAASAPDALARSGRQVARAVRAALMRDE
jgi:hypothetical protein